MKSVGNIFPVPHVALIYQDGSVFDLSLHEDLSPSQGKLLKLPKDEGYFGYSDPQGVLYLISATIYRKITKYHRSFNHRTIQDSGARGYIDGYWEFWDELNDLSSSYYFKYGIQFGRKFWAMDHLMKGSNSPHPTSSIRSCDVTKNSFQWDIGDDIWTEASSIGLNHPSPFDPESFSGICYSVFQVKGIVAVNSSTILFFYNPHLENVLYDFETQDIVKYPALVDSNTTSLWNQAMPSLGYLGSFPSVAACSLATLVGKNQRR